MSPKLKASEGGQIEPVGEASVIWNQKMEGWFVLLDLGEASDRLVEAVISSVVIHQRDLSH
jgi:hypothetical protein